VQSSAAMCMDVCVYEYCVVTHPKIGCGCCVSAVVCIQKNCVQNKWKNLCGRRVSAVECMCACAYVVMCGVYA